MHITRYGITISPMTRQNIEKKLLTVLNDIPQIRLAILYGSVARDTHRRDSDVDLAVAGDSRVSLSEEDLIDMSLRCSRSVGMEVQVRDIGRSDGLFLKQVLTTGRILLSRDSTIYGELIVRMLDFATDMLPNIRMIHRRNEEYFYA